MSSASDVSALLALQDLDTTLSQLHHRATHLPADAELAALLTKRQNIEQGVADSRAAANSLDQRQATLETQIHDVDAKIDHASKTLYSGSVTASRELQALEADIASLKKHRGELEDTELEILVEREPLDQMLADTDATLVSLDADRVRLADQAVQEKSEIAAKVETTLSERATLASSIAAETVALYDKVRAANKGIGAAKLEHGTCMACRLKLSAVDLDRIKAQPADAIVRCEECGAILVRP